MPLIHRCAFSREDAALKNWLCMRNSHQKKKEEWKKCVLCNPLQAGSTTRAGERC